MVSSTLENTKGKLPETSPFDLRDVSHFPGRDFWSAPPPNLVKGDLWIDYPFKESCNNLGERSSNPTLASQTRTQLELHVNSIVKDATIAGIDHGRVRWAVDELVTNATQYGAISLTNEAAGLIRLEWHIDNSTPSTIALAVTNPCQQLFDASRFARMEIVDFYSMENTSTNAHLGTIAMMSYLKEGTKLSYMWEMKNGEKIRLSMEPIAENAPDHPENFAELMKPTRIDLAKFDSSNKSVPYSFDQFQRDIESKVSAESVTVSCVIV